MFFSSGVPRSSTSSEIFPAASSRTRAEMQMPPGSASASMPRRDVHAVAEQVVALARPRRPDAGRCEVAVRPIAQPLLDGDGAAQRLHRAGNSASSPSPVVLKTRPPCSAISGSTTSRRSARSRASVPASSAPISRE